MTPLITPINPQVRESHLLCHSEGHQWRPDGVLDPMEAEPGMRAPFGGNGTRGRRSACVSCGAERVRWYTRGGEVVNRYRYQEGYLHHREDPEDAAPTRLEWRQRLVVTLFEELPTAEPQPVKPARRRRA